VRLSATYSGVLHLVLHLGQCPPFLALPCPPCLHIHTQDRWLKVWDVRMLSARAGTLPCMPWRAATPDTPVPPAGTTSPPMTRRVAAAARDGCFSGLQVAHGAALAHAGSQLGVMPLGGAKAGVLALTPLRAVDNQAIGSSINGVAIMPVCQMFAAVFDDGCIRLCQ
jgi:hypothetical protein